MEIGIMIGFLTIFFTLTVWYLNRSFMHIEHRLSDFKDFFKDLLRSEVKTLDNLLKSEVKTLDTRMGFMEKNIDQIQIALTNHVTDTDKKIDELKTDIKEIKNLILQNQKS